MDELRLHPVMNPALVAAVMVVLVTALSLRPKFGNLTLLRRAALVWLRLVVVLLTLVAMLRPEFVYTKRTPQRGSLVILVDDSRSMQVEDSLGDESRWASVKSLLSSAAADLAKLAQTWDVSGYRFDVADAAFGNPRRQSRPAGGAKWRTIGSRCGHGRCARSPCQRTAARRAAFERRGAAGRCAARLAAANRRRADDGREHSALYVHVRQIGRQRAGRSGDRRPRDERDDLCRGADGSSRSANKPRLRQPAGGREAALGDRRRNGNGRHAAGRYRRRRPGDSGRASLHAANAGRV